MVHAKLARAALGRMSSTAGLPDQSIAVMRRSRHCSSKGGPSETGTDDDDNRSTSSSQSTNRNQRLNQPPVIMAVPPLAAPEFEQISHSPMYTRENSLCAFTQSCNDLQPSTSMEIVSAPAQQTSKKSTRVRENKKRGLFLVRSKKKRTSQSLISPGTDCFSQSDVNEETTLGIPSHGMKRCYSDLEPVLTVGKLLKVPVDELVGIEFIDEDVDDNQQSFRPFIPHNPSSIYRLKLDPTLCNKSATFENLHSARREKTIRKRLDVLLRRTRRGVSLGLRYTSSLFLRRGNSRRRSRELVPGEKRGSRDSSRSLIHQFSRSLSRQLTTAVGRNRRVKHNSSSKSNTSNNSAPKYRSRAQKALRMISFILGVFVITWTPYHILAIMKGFCDECVNNTLYAISYWFCYLNSPISKILINHLKETTLKMNFVFVLFLQIQYVMLLQTNISNRLL